MRRFFGFLIGVIVGSLVGSTVALLLAPDTGDELRSHIRDRGSNFLAEVQHAADTRRIELRERLEELRSAKA